MDRDSISPNMENESSRLAEEAKVKLHTAPTASPEQLSEPEMDGTDHAIDREQPLTPGESERVERAVASLLPGPPDTHRVVAVEKRQVLVKSSEVVMVNGKSIELEGQEGNLIKECLISGQLTNYPQLLNQLLVKAGLLLDSTREQTIQTQLQLNSTVTTRESAAVLPSEEKYSNHGAEKPIAISDGCPAPRAQVQQATETSCISASREVQWGGEILESTQNILLSESSDTVDNKIQQAWNEKNYVDLIKGPHHPNQHMYEYVSSTKAKEQHKFTSTGEKNKPTTSNFKNPNLTRKASASLKKDEKREQILSGTIEELIHELVPRAHIENCPTEAFQFSFLLGSRLFLTPSRLLSEVARRADQLAHMMSTSSHPAFVTNLVDMLQRWMVSFPMDFQEESAMQPTKRLARLAVERHPPSEPRVNQLLQTLSNHLQAMEKHEKRLHTMKTFNVQIETPMSFSNPSNSKTNNSASHANAVQISEHVKAADNLAIILPDQLLCFEAKGLLNPVLFAQELTRIELCEHLYFLGPEELVNNFAKESTAARNASSSKPESSMTQVSSQSDNHSIASSHNFELNESTYFDARVRAAKKTTNLKAYIEWFNRLSFLVATSVCENSKKKLRVKTIEFWIEVARECINHANFNSLMGIITGLNMTPVRRLKRTWAKITGKRGDPVGHNFKKHGLSLVASGFTNPLSHSSGSTSNNHAGGKFAVLEHQMDPTSNFLSYRSTLKAAVSRSQTTTDQVQRVVIPFFSLLVKDLYFVNEGCATVIPSNGHLNFEKFNRLGQRLSEFAQWKNVECPYDKLSAIADFLQCYPIYSEEVLDFQSYECESPEFNEEKDRSKRLKQQFKASKQQITNISEKIDIEKHS